MADAKPLFSPLVSVIIPTYNRRKVLARALNSIFAQTYDNYEIIIIDDCSDDGTREWLTSLDDPRLHYIFLDKNTGPAHARNVGLERARGEFIAFLDSDDIWCPRKLEKQLKVFHEHPDIHVVYTRCIRIGKDGSYFAWPVRVYSGNILDELLVENIVVPTSSVMVRRECFNVVGGFDENFPSCMDWDLWVRIAEHFKFFGMKDILVCYFETHDQITFQSQKVVTGHYLFHQKHFHKLIQYGKQKLRKHAYRFGQIFWLHRSYKKARELFWKAWKHAPWNLWYALHFFGTFGGIITYKILFKLELMFQKKHHSIPPDLLEDGDVITTTAKWCNDAFRTKERT